MSNPFWLGSGGCPQVQVSADLVSLIPTLLGYSEFGAQSTPPNFYRTYNTAGGWNATYGDDSTETVTGVAATGLGWNSDGSVRGGTYDAINSSTGNFIAGYPAPVSPPPANFMNGANPGSPYPSAASYNGTTGNYDLLLGVSPANITIAVVSPTECQFTQPPWSLDGDSGGGGIWTMTLADLDLPSDAVTRTLAAGGGTSSVGPVGPAVVDIFAAGVFTVYENRSASATNTFNYQSCSVEFLCSNLAPGVLYHPVVLLESVSAVGNGTGDTSGYGTTWTSYGTLSLANFRPSGTTYTIPATALPVVAGLRIRIKSISLTPISG